MVNCREFGDLRRVEERVWDHPPNNKYLHLGRGFGVCFHTTIFRGQVNVWSTLLKLLLQALKMD